MGKKKKKGYTGDEDKDDVSTDEDQELSTSLELLPNCPHVGKAVNIGSLKKSLKAAWLRVGTCGPCAKDKRASNTPSNKPSNLSNKPSSLSNKNSKNVIQSPSIVAKNLDLSKSIWMCLKCGVQSCGPSSLKESPESGHSFCHYKTPRSDLHCILVNVETWGIFCFECRDDLFIDSYKKLREAVELVKKTAEVKSVNKPAVMGLAKKATNPSMMNKSPSLTTFNNAEAVKILKARGLTNLGNTCFFNAVMQCLTQSHPLTHVLDHHCQKGAPFCTPPIMNTLQRMLSNSSDCQVETNSLQDSGMSTTTTSSMEEAAGEICESTNVEPLSMVLNEAGPVTLALAAFLKEMHSVGKSGAFNPGHLFGQVCRRSPQFRGFQQQDAHELLRHLLDSLRTEEVKRQKTAILKQYGLSEKTDPKTVSVKLKKKLQALGRYSNFTLIDKIFGGQLVSTIVCEQCHNSSQIYEPFLDLSLPLIEEKPQRPGKNKNEDDEDEKTPVSCFGGFRKKKDDDNEGDDKKMSKTELKKAKAQAKKQKKLAKKQQSVKEDEQVIGEERKLEKELEENEKNEASLKEDGDVSKPEEEQTKIVAKPALHNKFEALQKKAKSPPKRILQGSEEDDEDGFSIDEEDDDWEWDYDDEEKESKDSKDDSGAAVDEQTSDYIEFDAGTEDSSSNLPKVSLNPLPPERLVRSSEEREKSSETGHNESSETGSHGDIEDNLDETVNKNVSISIQDTSGVLRHLKPFKPDPERLDPHMEALCRKVRKLSVSMADPNICGGIDPAASASKEYELSDNDEANDEDFKDDINSEKHQLRLQNDWIARSLTSIAPRYHAKTGECSVYSCLAQFTAPELLTGQNKWACDKCTRLHQEMTPESDCSSATENKPKTIYSNASKQLLIFCPPAVLTIHLKRFQQTMFSLRKVNKHVQFPMTLDLAPFCSSTSISMPTVQAGVNEIQYTLFGIVEHSGRLQGGHYTAYVKLRPSQVNLNENFKQFYSSPTAKNEEINTLLAEIERKSREVADHYEDSSSSNTVPGKWYHISDTSVTEVSEEKVLKCQAYLLFYERIK